MQKLFGLLHLHLLILSRPFFQRNSPKQFSNIYLGEFKLRPQTNRTNIKQINKRNEQNQQRCGEITREL
jgi:hypothetical protein